jgi:multiple sugar transport system substrate-binding protein
MTELYSRRSFLAGVLTAGMLSTSAGYLLTRRESISLTLATGADDTGGRQLLVTMWNTLNPDTQIITREVNSSTRDQFDKFIERRADIYNLDAIHIPRFAARRRIVPFTPRNDISLLSPVRRVSQREDTDEFWAAPFNTDVGMLYRRVADKTADPEPTLQGVMRDAPASFVGQLDTVGTQTDEVFVVNVLEQALAQDDAILSSDGVLSFSLGQWRDALGPLADAIRRKRINTEAGEDDTIRTFQRHDLRYMRNWPVHFPVVNREESAKPDTAEIRLGRLPTGILGGQGLAVSRDCEHREEAERAIHFLTDTPAQKLLATFGFAPTGVDAYIDAQMLASMPHLRTIRNAVEASRPRPMHPNYAEFAARFTDHTHRYLYAGEQLTQRFIQDIQEALR